MTLYRNAWDFIPLTMILLTGLAVGTATGRADLTRRNQMQALCCKRGLNLESFW
jgi:hypothetical protein